MTDEGQERARPALDENAYAAWHRAGICERDDRKEIISDGILTADEGTLVFESGEDTVYLPVNGLRNINIYSDATVNASVFSYLRKHNITLTVFDKFGNIAGRFVPEEYGGRAETFLHQAQHYTDEGKRLLLAKEFVRAELWQTRENLRYYRRHRDSGTLADVCAALGVLYDGTEGIADYAKLLLHEARGRELYYSCFNDIIAGEEFRFRGRFRRPPADPLNALISFGNAVLYNAISNEIQKTSLSVKIGYLHATGQRAESLNLDISEIFKPIIVDRVIFTLLNQKMMNEREHFEQHGEGVWLSREGKRIFLAAYWEKLNSTFTADGRRISYRKLIWEELLHFQAYINGESESYRAFHYK